MQQGARLSTGDKSKLAQENSGRKTDRWSAAARRREDDCKCLAGRASSGPMSSFAGGNTPDTDDGLAFCPPLFVVFAGGLAERACSDGCRLRPSRLEMEDCVPRHHEVDEKRIEKGAGEKRASERARERKKER